MKKKVIITSALVLILGGSAFALSMPKEEQTKVEESVQVVEKKKEVRPVGVKIEEVDQPEVQPADSPVQQTVAPQEVATNPPQTVVNLTPQQYGEKYLDLSGENQYCFNKILETYPERFTPDIAESNVKALRGYGSVCSSGILSPTGNINVRHNAGSSFFDSEIAAQFRN